MTLISALLGIAADRLFPQLHDYRRYDWFMRYVDWMSEHLNSSAWEHVGGLLLMLSPLWLAVAMLQVWVADWLFGGVGVLFYATVFFYCLGPRDLGADVDSYCEDCRSGDTGVCRRAAGRLLREGEPEDEPGAGRMTGAVLVEAGDRLFAVLFWFALLGPAGAVIYRSVSVLYRERREHNAFADSIAWLYGIVLWAPARALALGLALAGHFDAALQGWREAHRVQPQGVDGSDRVLVLTGSGALARGEAVEETPGAEPVRAAMRLVERTLMLWLVVLSLLVLAGWAG
jgi:AmpE protein